jgi:GTP cyclohydrolase II
MSASSSSSSSSSGAASSRPAAPPAKRRRAAQYISLTTHPHAGRPVKVNWGAREAQERGPVIAIDQDGGVRNAIGAHGGSYSIYKALSVATGGLDPDYRPDLTNTDPAFDIGPHPSWEGDRIVSLDPWGHLTTTAFGKQLGEGLDIRPTIAVTKAHIDILEIKDAIAKGRLVPDGRVLKKSGQVVIGKAAIEPVWHLPGIAKRMDVAESELRRELFQQTNGMYPELLTRTDISTFLPPIGGMTVYIFGDPAAITDPKREISVRVHDECNGSDVFGSDICTCRPYLIHAIEVCVKQAQEGGCGIIVFFRKEGRALG